MMPSHTTLEQKFVELQNADETPQINSQPKIQRVPMHLRNRKQFKEHYLPRLVSIGPIHYDNPNLKLGEKYKLMWAKQYIKENFELINPQNLHKKIVDNIDELKKLFSEDVLTLIGTKKSLKGFRNLDEKLSWILFIDGCSLLHILMESLNIKHDQLFVLARDVLLLENQLPYLVLKLLWKNENETELINTMREFLDSYGQWNKPENETNNDKRRTWRSLIQETVFWLLILLNKKKEEQDMVVGPFDPIAYPLSSFHEQIVTTNESGGCSVQNKKEEEEKEEEEVRVSIPKSSSLNPLPTDESKSPTHLLDLQYRIILPKSSFKIDGNGANNINQGQKSLEENTEITYRNIKDLRAAGINIKSSATRRPTDIAFIEGWFAAKLILPEIVVDDSTSAILLNLIAYEMCPDFDNDYGICSFAMFMDSLIDHPNDVMELRSKGILVNYLGSDQEVADLFNIMNTDLVFNEETYKKVKDKINKHYCNKYKTWIALGMRTYLNNPWAFIGVLAAFIALTLTFLQTWFTINPAK